MSCITQLLPGEHVPAGAMLYTCRAGHRVAVWHDPDGGSDLALASQLYREHSACRPPPQMHG